MRELNHDIHSSTIALAAAGRYGGLTGIRHPGAEAEIPQIAYHAVPAARPGASRGGLLSAAGALVIAASVLSVAGGPIAPAHAETTITVPGTTDPIGVVTTLSDPTGGFEDSEAQYNTNNTLEAIVEGSGSTTETDSGEDSDVDVDDSGTTIEARGLGNLHADDGVDDPVSLNSINDGLDEALAYATGQLNSDLTVDVRVENSEVLADLTDLSSGVVSISDALIQAEGLLNVSDVAVEDLPNGSYTSGSGDTDPASLTLDYTGATTTGEAAFTVSTAQINNNVDGGADPNPVESQANDIRIDGEVDDSAPGFSDTLTIADSTTSAGMTGNDALTRMAFDVSGSFDASSGVSNVQANVDTLVRSFNNDSTIEIVLTERDDPATIASLEDDGSLSLTGSSIEASTIGSFGATTLDIAASGGIDAPNGAVGVTLDVAGEQADVDAGAAGLNAQVADSGSQVTSQILDGTIGITADNVDGGTVSLGGADDDRVAVAASTTGNETENLLRLDAVGDLGGDSASAALGSAQVSEANIRALNGRADVGVTVGEGDEDGTLTGDGTASVEQAEITASATGNEATNQMDLEGGDVALSPDSPATAGQLGEMSADFAAESLSGAAGATLANMQRLDGAGGGNSGNVRADVSRGDVFLSIQGNASEALDGTASVKDSLISADAEGNVATNLLDVTSDSGVSGTVSLGSVQAAEVDDQFVRGQVDGEIALTAADATDANTPATGDFTVSGNAVEASAATNDVTNQLQIEGEFSPDDTAATVVAGASVAAGSVDAGAGATLVSGQLATDTVAKVYAADRDQRIGVDLSIAEVAEDLTVTLDDNTIGLTAEGNQGLNILSIDSDGSVTESNGADSTLAALASGQSAGSTQVIGGGLVDATIDATTLAGDTVATVSGNTISGEAAANDVTNQLTVDGNGGVSSANLTAGSASASAAGVDAQGGVAVANAQESSAVNADLDAANTAQNTLGATLDIAGALSGGDTLTGTLGGNRVDADASANTATNIAAVNALGGGGNVTDTSVALANGQVANNVSASVTEPTLSIGVTNTAFPTDSSTVLSITGAVGDDPEIGASAQGNDADNLLRVEADGAVSATTAANGTAHANNEASDADHALINSQLTGGAATITAAIADPVVSIDMDNGSADANNVTASIKNQDLQADAGGNVGASDLVLVSEGGVASTQALTNVQEMESNVSAVAADMDLHIRGGPNTSAFVDSELAATGNRLGADARGNEASNTLLVDSSSIAGVADDAGAFGNNNARSRNALSSRQEVVGAGISLNAEATGTIAIELAAGSLTNLENSTANANNNAFSADLQANEADNAVLLGLVDDPAGSVTANGALRNAQEMTEVTANSSANGTVNVDFDDVEGSNVSVTGNESTATLGGNQANNDLSVRAASIEAGSGSDAVAWDLGGARGGYALASDQAVTVPGLPGLGATAEGSFSGNAEDGFAPLGGEGSTVTVSDNLVRAQTDLNSVGDSVISDGARQDVAESGNDLRLEADGGVDATAALSNLQGVTSTDFTEVATTATASFSVDADSDDAGAGGVTSSTASLNENVAEARMRGNNALNNLVVDAVGGVSAGGGASLATADTTAPTRAEAGLALSNIQTFVGVGDGLNVTTETDSTVHLSASALSQASASLDGNRALAESTLNRARNTVTGSSTGSVEASGALTNEQTIDGPVTVNTSTEQDVLVRHVTNWGSDNVDDSAVSLSGNEGIAASTGNYAVNRLDSDAVGDVATLLGGSAAPSDVSTDTGSTNGVAEGDYALASRQTNDATMTSDVSGGGVVLDMEGGSNQGAITASDNVLWADTVGNTVPLNELRLNGSAVSASAGLANVQRNAGALSSTVDASSVRVDFGANLVDSAVDIGNNQIRATATANNATNTVDVTSAQGITSAASPGGATAQTGTSGTSVTGAGLSALNAQRNVADVTSTITGSSVSLSAGGASHSDSAVALRGNIIAANATGNSARTDVNVGGLGRVQTPVGIANRQSNSGNTITASVSNASVSSTFNGGVDSTTVSHSGNTIAATARGNVSGNSVSVNNALSRASTRLNR
ncbi:hypothetical protein [Arhodomonas sp. SL1]|uniref:hypothetical protein n=1 Tax=Arhodomonas sp. SL1 TaxID=3425691 RepID=UPI003F881FDA